MSKTVDERVVEMRFDNQQFEKNVQESMSTLDKLKQSLKLDGSEKGFEKIDEAAGNVSFQKIQDGVEALEKRFSTMGIVGMRVLENITDSVMNLASRMTSFVTSSVVNGGIKRAMNIENAHFQLQGLLKDEERVQAVMDDAMDSVDGTAYAYDEAAKAASQFAASGMEAGDEMKSALRAITGVAAMTNSEYESISQIFTTVAGNGRLMGDQLLQLSSRGLNAAATIADYLTKVGDGAKVTESEVREMVSAGEISFQTFAAAMDDAFGEHAKKANETFTGAMSNVKASLARIGAEFVSPLVEQNGALVQLFNTLRERINDIKAAIGPLADLFVDSVTAMAEGLTDFLSKLDLSGFSSKMEFLSNNMSSSWEQLEEKITDTGVATEDFQNALAETAESHGIAVNQMIEEEGSFEKSLKNGWLTSDIFAETLERLAGNTEEVADVTSDVTGKIENLQEVVANVIRGDFGNGEDRIKALTEAGYDYATVQDLVNRTLAGEVVEFDNLSDEQLESLGYTKKQISAMKKLARQAQKTGTPVNELVESLSTPSGKDLLFSSIGNVLKGITTAIKAIRDAWKETFKSSATNQLYNLISGLHSLSEHFVLSEENADKLKRTFKGLFAVLDIVTSFIGGGLKTAFKLFSSLLGMMDLNVLDVTASIGDAIVAFHDWLSEHNALAKGVKALCEWLPDAQGDLTGISAAFSDTWTKLQEHFSGGGAVLQAFINRVKSLKGLSLRNLVTVFKDFAKNVAGYFLDIGGAFTSLKTAIGNLADDAVEHFLGLEGGVDDVTEKVSEFASAVTELFTGSINDAGDSVEGLNGTLSNFTSDDGIGGLKDKLINTAAVIKDAVLGIVSIIEDHIGEVMTIVIGLGMIQTIRKVASVLGTITTPIIELTKVIANFNGILSTAKLVLKDVALVVKAFAIETGSRALINVAIAVGILSASLLLLSQVPADRIGAAAEAMVLMAVGLAAVAAVLTLLGGSGHGANAKAFASLFGIAVSLVLLSKILKDMEDLDEDRLWGNLAVLGVMAAGLAAVAVVVAKSASSLSGAAAGLIAIAVALKIFASSLVDISGIKFKSLTKSLVILIGSMAGLAKFATICQKVSLKAALGMAAVVIALRLFVGALNTMAKIDYSQINSNIGSIIIILLLFVGLMAASKLAGDNAAKAGVGILGMSTAIYLLIGAIKLLSTMDGSELAKGVAAVSGMLIVFSAVVALSKLAGKNAIQAGAMLLLMSGAIVILTGAIAVLQFIDAGALARAVAAISVLGLVFAGIIAASYLAKECRPTLVIMAVTIGLLGVMLGALSFIEPGNLVAATIAISAVMGMFALIIASTHYVKKCMKTLAVMSLAVGVLGATLYLLAKLPVESALASSIALSVLLLSFAGSLLIIGKAQKIGKDAYISLGIMVLVAGVVGVLLGLLAYLDVNPSIATATAIGVLLVALSGACLLLSKVGVAGKAAFIGIGVLAALIAAVSVIIGVIGALTTYIPKLEQFLDKGIVILEKIGYGIGSFVGSIIGGFTAGATSGLPAIAASLSNFMENMGTFFADVKGIDNDAVEGVKLLSDAIFTLVKTNALKTLIGGSSMFEFSLELNALAKGLKTFSAEVQGLNVGDVKKAAEAGKAVAEMADALPKSGGLKQLYTGNSGNMLVFAAQLKGFASGLSDFSTGVADVKKANVMNGAAAGKLVADMADAIPSSGGLFDIFFGSHSMWTFAMQLKDFASGLSDFSTGVAEVSKPNVMKGAAAGKLVADMADAIPETGWMDRLTGQTDMSIFSEQLGSFGTALKNFSSAAENVNLEDVNKGVKAGLAVVDMSNEIPDTKWYETLFPSVSGMDKISPYLKSFAEALADFSKASSGIKPICVTNGVNAGKGVIEMCESITNLNRLKSVNMDKISQQLTAYAGAIKDFADASKEIEIDVLENATEAGGMVLQMCDFATNLQTLEDVDMSTIKTGLEDFADALCGFSGKSSDIVEADIIKGTKAAELISEMSDNLFQAFGKDGADSLSELGESLASFGENIKKYSDSVSDINVENLAEVTEKLKELAGAADEPSTESTETKSIGSFFSGLAQKIGIGTKKVSDSVENGVNDVVDTMNESEDDAKEAGKGLIDSTTEGMESAMPTFNSFTSGLLSSPTKSIEDSAPLLKQAAESTMDQASSSVKSKADTLGETVKTSISNSVDDAATGMEEAGASSIESLVSGAESKIPDYTDTISDALGMSVEDVESYFPDMESAGALSMEALASGAESETSDYTSVMADALGISVEEVESYFPDMESAGALSMEALASGAESGTSDVATAVSNVAENGVAATSSYYDDFADAGKYLVEGFANGISENTYLTEAKAAAMAQKADTAARNALVIKSPSKVFEEIGAYVAEGFALGISDGTDGAEKAAEELARVGTRAAQEVLDSLNSGDSVFADYVESTEENGEAVETTLEQAAEAFSSFRDSVKESLTDATGLFDAFEAGTEVTAKEILSNLQSQIEGITEWANDIQLLAARGVSQELLKALSDLGTSGANYVSALVSMSDKQLKKLDKLYKERLALNDTAASEIAVSFLDGGTQAGKAYVQGLSEALGSAKATFEAVGADSASALARSSKIVSDATTELSDLIGWTFADAVKNMKSSLDYGKGAFKQFCNAYLTATDNITAGTNAIQAAANAITAYGEKLYEESEYYEEDTANLKAHKKELTSLQKERKKLQKQLKKAQKSNTAASKAQVATLKEQLATNKELIAEAKAQIEADEDEIAEHTKEVYNDLQQSLSDSIASFLDPLEASLETGIDLFSEFTESSAELYEEDKKNLEEQQKTLEELEAQQKSIQDEISSYSDQNTLAARKRVKELNEQLSEVEDSIEETKDAIEQTEDDMASHSEVTVDSILENMQSQVEGVSKWRQNLKELAAKGVSQGLLDELEEMGTSGIDYVDQFLNMTADEIASANSLFAQSESLASQTLLDSFEASLTEAEDWAAGLQQMAQMGFGQDLLEKLGDMGVDGYDYVKAFLSMSPEQVAEFNQQFANSLTLPDTLANQVISSYAYAGGQSVEGFTSALAALTESGTEENAVLEASVDGIVSFVSETLSDGMRTAGKTSTKNLAKGLESKVSKATTSASFVAEETLDSLSDVLSARAGKTVAGDLVKGLKKGLLNGESSVSATAEQVAKTAYKAAKTALGIKSPSKKFAELGEYTDAGFVKGLSSGEDGVRKTAADVMEQAIQEASDAIGSGIDAQPTISPVIDLTDVRAGAAAISSMIGGQSLSGQIHLASNIAGGMEQGMASDPELLDAVRNLSDTISGFMDRPMEQYNNFTINGTDAREIANEVSHIIQQQVERRNAAWA